MLVEGRSNRAGGTDDVVGIAEDIPVARFLPTHHAILATASDVVIRVTLLGCGCTIPLVLTSVSAVLERVCDPHHLGQLNVFFILCHYVGIQVVLLLAIGAPAILVVV